MLKILSKIKNAIVSTIIGIGLSILNILKGNDFLEYTVSILGDVLSVVFDYDKKKQENIK